MAHNVYYPSQAPQHGQASSQPGSSPGGQQYAQYYQQPQNIYQQLGQSQPQPHLQRIYQQPPYQQQPAAYAQPPVQSHGFVQRPLSTSFQAPQQSYVSVPPSHTPFRQPPLQQQYAPANQSYQQTSPFNNLQQPPSTTGYVPTTSYVPPSGYSNQQGQQTQMVAHDLSQPPAMLAQQQQQRRTPQPPPQGYVNQQMLMQESKPPPIAPSAISAQQVQNQRRTPQPLPGPAPPSQAQMQLRTLQQPQQHQSLSSEDGGRRPLPRAVPGDPTPMTTGLVRPSGTPSRPMSMPPTKTSRLPPISTSTASQMNQSPNQQHQQPMSTATIPPPSFVQQQIQQIQQMQMQKMQNQGQNQAKPLGSGSGGGSVIGSSSSSSSPTKSRPLPTAPGSAAVRRMTVDLGNVSDMPNSNTGSGFNFHSTNSFTNSNKSASPVRGGFDDGRSPSPAKCLPFSTPGSSTQTGGMGLGGGSGTSRTTSMAAGQPFCNSNSHTLALDNDNTPKRRPSPPIFSANSTNSSLSSSPSKEDFQRTGWNADDSGSPTKESSNVFANRPSTSLSSQGSNSNGGGSNMLDSTPNVNKSGATSPNSTTTMPKKFTPVWKRTIPDYPAPVFGYAAGMVADPFGKPTSSPNTSSTNLPSSSNKNDHTTPKATKVAVALTPKEQKKQEKEEKKRLKEEEKQRKKAAKAKGIPVPPQIKASPSSSLTSSSGVSMLPYLQSTPPRNAPGEYSKAYVHGQGQYQHQQRRDVQQAGAMVPYSTPTRQIQVRGQPVYPGAVARYSQQVAQPQKEESTEDEEEEEEEEEESEEEDLEVAYQYEGSDYSSTSEHEHTAPVSQKDRHHPQIRHQEQEEEFYGEVQQQQQQLVHLQQPLKTKKAHRASVSPRQYEEYEEQRPSPNSGRHVKTCSSASDGFVVIHQQHQQSPSQGSRNAKQGRKSGAGAGVMRPSPDRRSPGQHARGHSYSHSNSEDDWEQLQEYESPRKIKPPKGKGRRHEEPSEEEEENEDDEYEDRRRCGQGHRREASERDAGTVRKYPVRESELPKQQVGRGVRERAQDIGGKVQAQKGQRQYQQQLRYDVDDDDDERGRQKNKVGVPGKKTGKGNIIKEILAPQLRPKHDPGPEDEYEEDDDDDDEQMQYSRQIRGKSQSQSPTKKQTTPRRKLVKKNWRRHLANAEASETDSQAEFRDGDDHESVVTTNTRANAASRLVNKFSGAIKFTGGQQKQPSPSHQRSATREVQPQQPQRQSGFQPPPQQGFQSQLGKKLYFGIADHPPPSQETTSNNFPSSSQEPPSRMIREVNRERVGLKLDMLDDPPPRSLRTPSPSPDGSTNAPRRQPMYQFPSEIERQQMQPQARQQPVFQQQQSRRPHSQAYSAVRKSSFMDDIPPEAGSENVQPQRRQLPQPQERRPQSQGHQQNQRPIQRYEEQQQQRSDFSEQKPFDSMTGLPTHHQKAMQGYAPPPQAPLSRRPSQRQLPQQYTNDRQAAPSTPHQQQPINIESPALLNIMKMDADGVAHEQQQRQFQQQHNQHQYQGQMSSSNAPTINISGASEPPKINIHHTGGTAMSSGTHRSSPMIPMINFDPAPSPPSPGPRINISEAPSCQLGGNGNELPPSSIQVSEIPGISVSGPEFDERPGNGGAPQISTGVSGDDGRNRNNNHGQPEQQQQQQSHFVNPQGSRPPPTRSGTGGLICGGCEGPIVGRIVFSMGVRWHPQCFQCTVCQELLEHVSSYEHDGRPYCHLDYHENFAPRCYSCKTPIIEEQFISLDDPALGKRTYHMEHFFCAECGDPFLTPSMSRTAGELALSGDGDFEGFTVYRGHPYCEACHVRLRLPKCKKCKKSIRDHDRAVEALGGKWCWTCFVCDGCERPFDDPSFFQRDNRPYCEHCFSLILRNEV